ncbi:hypothetical protein GTA08_BOTSDO12605 [Neofusicoccum parvum]|uniref:Uncharacterized protein n=1 Tax=Neofusicoccum parvum TaxID=310453 RepID=A0ACB5SPK3_9PEZI|nr:hypothetical protein GTA08_BOTSDO12605 [Neofusicoccum parvum]
MWLFLLHVERRRGNSNASNVKGLADLTFHNSFKTATLSQLQDDELGGGLDDVFEELIEFEQHYGVVPSLLRPSIGQLPQPVRGRFRDHNYAPADAESRSEFDIRREFHDAQDLLQRSEELEESAQYSEAAWNDGVHSRVLEIPLRRLPAVRWHNVTTARISPLDLLPRHHLGSALESKTVDYAIVPEPSSAFERDHVTAQPPQVEEVGNWPRRKRQKSES